MKSFVLIIVALMMVGMFRIQPAAALSVDHDSTYANAGGGSRFSDPDDALGGDDTTGSNQFGSVQLGNSSDAGGMTFGMYATGGDQADPSEVPGYAMQGCLAAVCQY